MQIFLMFAASIGLFTFQTICFKHFNRHYMKKAADYFIFTALYCVLMCIFYAVIGLDSQQFTPRAAALASVFAASFIFAMFCYMRAMENGPLGLSFLFFSAGLLLPIIFGIVFYNEPAPLHKAVGLLLMFTAFYMSAKGDSDSGGQMSRKWVVYILLGALGNGVIGVAQKLYRITAPQEAVVEFLFIAFGMAAVMAAVIGAALLYKNKGSVAHMRAPGFALALTGAAVTTAGGNYAAILLSLMVSALVQYPVVSGALVITSILSSRIVFKETITKRHLIVIGTGLIAIVVLSL